MQSILIYTALGVSYLLLIMSVFFVIFSKFKHIQFKQHLLYFLNIGLVIQLILATVHVVSDINADISHILNNSYWFALTLQLLCSVVCYMSVKRRKAKTRPSLDSFSMD